MAQHQEIGNHIRKAIEIIPVELHQGKAFHDDRNSKYYRADIIGFPVVYDIPVDQPEIVNDLERDDKKLIIVKIQLGVAFCKDIVNKQPGAIHNTYPNQEPGKSSPVVFGLLPRIKQPKNSYKSNVNEKVILENGHFDQLFSSK